MFSVNTCHHGGNVCLVPLFLCFVSAKETLQTAALEALEVGCWSTDSDNVVECIYKGGKKTIHLISF